jgi:uncharacterized protein with ParB-like and HNH nuclease domain
MSYQTALKISEVIENISKSKYLLPSIQREFVWGPEQIEKLFDSLMRDYPISSFLFWKVDKNNIKDYQFYKFLRNFHEKDSRHNERADLDTSEGVVAILDGQQRLTSLYIALKGSYAQKLPRKRWDNPDAYPSKKLYLNLLRSSENEEMEYEFKFLTKEESEHKNEDCFWFEVGKILKFRESHLVNEFLIEEEIFSKYQKQKASFANRCLSKLRNIIHEKESISYYLEKSEELDKVLQIFIRINSGGTVLSYSDLLLSIATAQWDERDAREEIHRFVDEINMIGDGFGFNKDFVLKSCLVLSDFSNVAFKVDNFKRDNMLAIQANWEAISRSIRTAIQLIYSFGYTKDTLTTTNAVIPVAYYLYKTQAPDSYSTAVGFREDRQKLREWLIRVILRKTFGGQPDTVYPPLRNLINNRTNGFPLEEIIEYFKGSRKSIYFSKEDLENLSLSKYGGKLAFSILAVLYPSLDFRNHFHIDHIFPRSLFTESKLRKRGLSEEQIRAFLDRVDDLPNLQLLEANPNMEKSSHEFKHWLEETYSNQLDKKDYKTRHYIPKEVELDFENFLTFYEERRQLILERLSQVLSVTQSELTGESEELS